MRARLLGYRTTLTLLLCAAVSLGAACGTPNRGDSLAAGGAGNPPDPLSTATLPPDGQGWTFLGRANGVPRQVLGVTTDQGGNLWVAGGEDGLYLLRPGTTKFERFTMADGLHPYGYPRPDQGTITRTYLNVLSVAGGRPGTVYVGYMGMPTGQNELGCEDNWDGPNPDPNIYKSGDADRVTLTDAGIEVVHYDISSGLNVVPAEPRGREKLCNVYRIAYDPASSNLWFGANHGYAWGDPNYAGDPSCLGQLGCSGVEEHAHPLLNGYAQENAPAEAALTNYYWGLAVEPNGSLWVGGMFRSQHCAAGARGANFFSACDAQGLDPKFQVDWWPDAVPADARPSQRVDDNVSGMSLAADGSLWIGSFTNGLAHNANGHLAYYSTGLVDPHHVTAVQVDPSDGSVWVGAAMGGLTRVQSGGQFAPIDYHRLGDSLIASPVPDIQIDTTMGGQRRILVAFKAGAVGIYSGK